MALQILGGRSPQQIPGIKVALTYIFDGRALGRWELNERDLSPGSIVMNGSLSLLESYRPFTIGALAVIILQAFLIGGLLWNRARRKYAEERFRAIFENSDSGISWVNMQGQFVNCNSAFLKMLGYSKPELCRLAISDITHPDDIAKTKDLFAEMVAGQRDKYRVEKRYIAKDGRIIWANVEVSTLKGQGSAPRYCIGMVEDITDRKGAESALSESEARFRSFFELPLAGCFVTVPGKTGIAANKRMSEMLGYSAEELRHMSWTPIMHPDDLEKSRRDYERLKANEIEGYVSERRCIRKDGSVMWVETAVGCVRDKDGSALQICGHGRDITERKNAEEALQKAEEDYQTIFDRSVSGIICVTTEGKILAANPALARIAGYDSPAELMANVNTHRLWRNELRRMELIRRVEQSEVVHGYEFEVLRRDGSLIWVSASARKISDGDGKTLYYEAFIDEITARKRLEEQLAQAQKMEAVGRLAGGIAHDFNSILGIIIGYADLILTDAEVSAGVSQSVSEIRDAANRAADVTRQLLAFSRKQVLQAQVLDLNVVVREAATMVGRLLGEHVELVLSLAPESCMVEIDPTGLHRIILNLAANARDAMPNGGKLTIETARVTLDNAFEPGRHSIPAGDYTILAMSDTGVGMDTETQKHLFEPFFTTKQAGSGTGMGLATVYGIVQQSSGYILVNGELGQGATFKIYLPRVESGKPHIESRPMPSIPRGNETVLLVEDNARLRMITAKLLRNLGYRVMGAQNASEAIAIADAHPEPLDLLVTDVIMPGMNGQELADVLSSRHPALKILFISGYTDTIVGDQISSRGAVFLQKPFSRGDLATKLREALAKPVNSLG